MNKTDFINLSIEDSFYLSLDTPKRGLAIKCLEAAHLWYNSQPKTSVAAPTDKEIQQLKNNCRKFILDTVKPSPIAYGYSSIFTSWIFYWILRSILNWAINRLFDS